MVWPWTFLFIPVFFVYVVFSVHPSVSSKFSYLVVASSSSSRPFPSQLQIHSFVASIISNGVSCLAYYGRKLSPQSQTTIPGTNTLLGFCCSDKVTNECVPCLTHSLDSLTFESHTPRSWFHILASPDHLISWLLFFPVAAIAHESWPRSQFIRLH